MGNNKKEITTTEIKKYLEKKLACYNMMIEKLEQELRVRPNSNIIEMELVRLKWIKKDTLDLIHDLFY